MIKQVDSKGNLELNNRGLSLVELIVAITIGSILAASIAALITFSLRTYHNESVNTAMQYEIQTNVNQMMDVIMESSGAVIVQGSDKTDYAGFGQFAETRDVNGAVTSVDFTGVVLVSGERDATTGDFDIYMKRISASAPVSDSDASVVIQKEANKVKTATDKRPYLLGQYAKEFKITLNTDSCIVAGNKYINPLNVDVELEFEKDGSGKTINKRVADNAVMRNKVTADIYVDGTKYELKK